MKKTYVGSCHCGAVRFEADIDFGRGTNKCNCSICIKTRKWSTMIKPHSFRLLTDEQALSIYRFGAGNMRHEFCRHCGVRPFERGHIAEVGGDFVSINVNCLDNVAPSELIQAPIRYFDGVHDNWTQPPSETRHL